MKEVEPELFDSIKEDLKKDFHQEQKNALDEWTKKNIERKFEVADGYRDAANRAMDFYIYAGYFAAFCLVAAAMFLVYSNHLRSAARIEMLELKLNAAS